MLRRKNLQEFTFRVFATKICLPYGTGMWSTVDEIDILEMFEGQIYSKEGDQYAYGTIHQNNQSNSMNPK